MVDAVVVEITIIVTIFFLAAFWHVIEVDDVVSGTAAVLTDFVF